MTGLLEIKEKIKNIYGRFDIYLNPLFKFIIAVCVFSIINGNIGYMRKLDSLPVILVLSLVCSVFPVNVTILVSAAVILLHLYALSLEVAVVAGGLFFLIALLYFRFAPRDGIYTLLTPICLHFNLGPVMPMAVGLTGKLYSSISVACGTVVWFFLDGVKQNDSALGSSSEDVAITSKFTAILNQLMGNKEMYLVLFSFVLVTVIVLIIRSLSIDYAWTAAIIIGGLVNFIVLFAGYVLLEIQGKVMGLVIGSLVSLVVALILEFFLFHLDYSRTERVQFEDDEYYYYVKAVPKMYVAVKEKQVKTINAKNSKKNVRKRPSGNRRED
ncbi:MAG: hypothetical protein HFI82_01915 [Eubacterium sp.]|nr:hypothetical protein [Eubacterium sp.]